METPNRPNSPFKCSAPWRSKSPITSVAESGVYQRQFSSPVIDTENAHADFESKMNSFTEEMANNLRELLRHALISIIFLTRVFALPLIYIVQKLSWPRGRRGFASIPLLHQQNAARKQTKRRSAVDPVLRTLLISIFDTITLPFRVIRALYHTCDLVQRHPEFFERIQSRNGQTSEAIEAHSFRRRNRKALPDVNIHHLAGAPASSEVYHAALSEDGDLDEVLSAFDVDVSSCGSVEDVINIQTPQEEKKPRRFQSIQNTPPEMCQEAKQCSSPPVIRMTKLHPSGFACFDSVSRNISQDNLAAPSISTYASTNTLKPIVSDRGVGMDDLRLTSLPVERMSPNIGDLTADTENLERCPTYVRRQRRSLLPGRFGTRSAVDLTSGVGHIRERSRQSTREPTSKQHAKLQKRRPPPSLKNRSSMNSLPRRF